MKVIIFGGTGWVGHQIALDLQRHGCEVTIACRGRKETFAAAVASIRQLRIDKSDPDAMARLFAAEAFDAVIDTVPTLASLELVATLARPLRHYIHCSSTGGYAPLPFIPCDETAPYGGFEGTSGWKQKADCDEDALRRRQAAGFPATVIRPCYITGPGMLPLDNLGGRRPGFIADILAEVPLDVPDNGLALLQPVHVHDLAVSFRLALEHPDSIGQVYNVCLSHAVTLNRYLELTAAALGRRVTLRPAPVETLLARYGSTIHQTGLRFLANHMCFSIDKARRDLGYQPHCSPEAAIAETARWAAAQIG